MILFHGSKTGSIEILEPRKADHERPYIYLTTIDVVAAFYLCNAVQKPYYWFPYGFENGNMDIPIYNELYPNALREVSEGVHGYIYKADVKENQVIPFKNIPCARLGTEPIPVSDCIEVPDAYALFKEYEKQGKLKIGRYEDKTKDELQWYYKSILEYLKEKEMYKTPQCSYALFIKKKFPFIWEEYTEKLIFD